MLDRIGRFLDVVVPKFYRFTAWALLGITLVKDVKDAEAAHAMACATLFWLWGRFYEPIAKPKIRGLKIGVDPALGPDRWQLRDPNTGIVLFDSVVGATIPASPGAERGE